MTALDVARAAFEAAARAAHAANLSYRRDPTDETWHAHRKAAEREAAAWHAYDALVKEARALGAREVPWARF